MPPHIEEIAEKVHQALIGHKYEDVFRVAVGVACVAASEMGMNKQQAVQAFASMWTTGFSEGEDGTIPQA